MGFLIYECACLCAYMCFFLILVYFVLLVLFYYYSLHASFLSKDRKGADLYSRQTEEGLVGVTSFRG